MPSVKPYREFEFVVEIDGQPLAGFREVSGLEASTAGVEYGSGGNDAAVHKGHGLSKYENITLRRGHTDSTELYDWYRKCAMGDVQRRNGSIVVLDPYGQRQMRWNFCNAWPAKWDGPGVCAQGTDINALEFAHEGVRKA